MQELTTDPLLRCDSFSRARELCFAMLGEPSPEKQIALFLEWFSVCDAPWAYRNYIAELLRAAFREVPLVNCLQPVARAWFIAQPPMIQIYRGCGRGRMRGLSWTTDLRVAEGFATGKRCWNKNPTLASAVIPKQHVFGVFVDRNEAEIAVDPRRLRGLTVADRPDLGPVFS